MMVGRNPLTEPKPRFMHPSKDDERREWERERGGQEERGTAELY